MRSGLQFLVKPPHWRKVKSVEHAPPTRFTSFAGSSIPVPDLDQQAGPFLANLCKPPGRDVQVHLPASSSPAVPGDHLPPGPPAALTSPRPPRPPAAQTFPRTAPLPASSAHEVLETPPGLLRPWRPQNRPSPGLPRPSSPRDPPGLLLPWRPRARPTPSLQCPRRPRDPSGPPEALTFRDRPPVGPLRPGRSRTPRARVLTTSARAQQPFRRSCGGPGRVRPVLQLQIPCYNVFPQDIPRPATRCSQPHKRPKDLPRTRRTGGPSGWSPAPSVPHLIDGHAGWCAAKVNSDGRHEAAEKAAAVTSGLPVATASGLGTAPSGTAETSRSRPPTASGPSAAASRVATNQREGFAFPFRLRANSFTASSHPSPARIAARVRSCACASRGGTGRDVSVPPPPSSLRESQWKLVIELRHLAQQLPADSAAR